MKDEDWLILGAVAIGGFLLYSYVIKPISGAVGAVTDAVTGGDTPTVTFPTPIPGVTPTPIIPNAPKETGGQLVFPVSTIPGVIGVAGSVPNILGLEGVKTFVSALGAVVGSKAKTTNLTVIKKAETVPIMPTKFITETPATKSLIAKSTTLIEPVYNAAKTIKPNVAVALGKSTIGSKLLVSAQKSGFTVPTATKTLTNANKIPAFKWK